METKENYFETKGVVLASRGNGNFLVKVVDFDEPVSCTLSGKIKKNTIRIIEGDDVCVRVSTYDTKKGRIVFRIKG